MKTTLNALIVAPLPAFVIIGLVLVNPAFGAGDAAISLGLALGASYGFMLAVGLPIHALLRRLGWHTWGHYCGAFLLGLLASITSLAWLEEPSPAFGPTDNALWVLIYALASPLFAIMATIFWNRAVADEPTNCVTRPAGS